MSRLSVGDRLSWPIPWMDADETVVQVTCVANGHVLVCTVLEPHTCANWMGGCELGGTTARAPEDWLPEPPPPPEPEWQVGDIVRDGCGEVFRYESPRWSRMGFGDQESSPCLPLTRLVPALAREEAIERIREGLDRALPTGTIVASPTYWRIFDTDRPRMAGTIYDALYPQKP